MEVIDLKKRYKCKNLICEISFWKIRYELDLVLLKIEKLNKELR